MYNVYNEDDEKIFGCSSLHAVIEYITEIGVSNVVLKTKNPGGGKARINLANGEHIWVHFDNNTAAGTWIQVWIPGVLEEVVSKESECIYTYKGNVV